MYLMLMMRPDSCFSCLELIHKSDLLILVFFCLFLLLVVVGCDVGLFFCLWVFFSGLWDFFGFFFFWFFPRYGLKPHSIFHCWFGPFDV